MQEQAPVPQHMQQHTNTYLSRRNSGTVVSVLSVTESGNTHPAEFILLMLDCF